MRLATVTLRGPLRYVGLYCEIKESLKQHSQANSAQKLRKDWGKRAWEMGKIPHSGAGLQIRDTFKSIVALSDK